MLRIAVLLAAFAPAAAVGHNAGVDFTAGSLRMADGSSSPYVGINLSGTLELKKDTWNLDLGYSALKDEGSGLRHLALAGAELTLGDHWSFSLSATGAPKISTTVDERLPVPLPGGKVVWAKGTLTANEWNVGAVATAAYDTFGESSFETALDLSVGATRYRVLQKGSVDLPNGSTRSADFDDALGQLKIALGATETFFLDTDASLRFTLFRYDKDPSLVGQVQRLGQPIGMGISVAPLSWEVRPALAHRFSRAFSLGLAVAVGRYVDARNADGTSSAGDLERTATLKAIYKPNRAWRLLASVTGQVDRSRGGEVSSRGFFAGLGASRTF